MNLNDRYNLEVSARKVIRDKLLNSDAVRDRLEELDSILSAMDSQSEDYKERFLMLVEILI